MAVGQSFYGGKPGVSYRIVQHYDSIKQMVDAFQKGGAYNTVNYGEYVIIDTIVNDNHYSSRENGIIYRRGLNYLEDFNPHKALLNSEYSISPEDVDEEGNKKFYTITTGSQGEQTQVFNSELFKTELRKFVLSPGGGAEYIGQIVGPQGESPQTAFINWDQFQKEYADENNSPKGKGWTQTQMPDAGAEFDENGNVIESSIRDWISYGYVNMRDKDDNITEVHLSLMVPYSVFKYHAESIEPYDSGYAQYDETEKVWKYAGLISEDQVSKGHPYFWQYDLKVPKGIRGQDLEKIDIELTGKTINDGDDVDQNDHNYQYYYVVRNYEKSAEGETTKTYLDSFNRTIFKITNDGIHPEYPALERSATYSFGDRVAAAGLPSGLCLECTQGGTTSVDDLVLSKKKGNDTVIDGTAIWTVVDDQYVQPKLLTIHYTHGDNDTVGIRVLERLIYEPDGRILVKYSDVDAPYFVGENRSILKVDYIDTPWVDDNGVSHTIDRLRITFNTINRNDNGDIIYDTNYSLDAQGNLVFPKTDDQGHDVMFVDEQFKFVDRIETDPATKDVICYYNDGTTSNLGHFKVVDHIQVEHGQESGHDPNATYLVIYYNDGAREELNEPYKVIKDISIQDASGAQGPEKHIIVTYNDGTTQDLGQYKVITDIKLDSTTQHVIVTYNDTTTDDVGLFKTVDRIETDPDTKVVTVYYKDGTTDGSPEVLGSLKNIDKIYVENEGDLGKTKKFKADYNTKDANGNTESVYLQDNPLNEVASVQQFGDNIIVLYSDPDVRKKLYKSGTDYAISATDTKYVIPNYTGGDDDGQGNLYWINLGSIYKSNHVFTHFTSVDQLKSEYPYGLENDTDGNPVESQKDHAGWIVTVSDEATKTTMFYAFDYKTKEWYKLQDLGAAAIKPGYTLVVSEADPADNNVPPKDDDSDLNVGGYWFVVVTRED